VLDIDFEFVYFINESTPVVDPDSYLLSQENPPRRILLQHSDARIVPKSQCHVVIPLIQPKSEFEAIAHKNFFQETPVFPWSFSLRWLRQGGSLIAEICLSVYKILQIVKESKEMVVVS
jgi:hypothetical protein